MTNLLPPTIAAQVVKLFRGERLYSKLPTDVIIGSLARQLEIDAPQLRDLLVERGLVPKTAAIVAVKTLPTLQEEARERQVTSTGDLPLQLGPEMDGAQKPSEGCAVEEAVKIIGVSSPVPSPLPAPTPASIATSPADVELNALQVRAVRFARSKLRLSVESLARHARTNPSQIRRICGEAS